MAKAKAKKHSKKSAEPAYPGAPTETHKKWRHAAVATAVLLILAVVAAYFLLGEQPAWIVWLLGLGCAAVAMVAYMLATHEPEHDDLVLRMQRGQSLDFGKRIRDTRKQRRKVKLPLFGETSMRAIASAGIFVLVFAWWLTPWGPVGIAERKIEDLSVPLTGELLAVVLVTPDGYLATVQPPLVSLQAERLAREIPDDADTLKLARKAIVEWRFAEARELLNSAFETGEAEAVDVHVALGQTELYAYRFEDAVKAFDAALQLKADDPAILCQATVAALHAGQYRVAEDWADRAVKLYEDKNDKPGEKQPAGPKVKEEKGDALEAAAYHLRAVLYTIRGRKSEEYDLGSRFYDRALEIQKKDDVHGEDHPYFAATVNNRALFNQLRAKYPGVLVMHNHARSIWRRELGEKHPHVAASLGNLAMFYYVLGQYGDPPPPNYEEAVPRNLDDAWDCNLRALAIRREAFPADPPEDLLMAVGLNATSLLERTSARYDIARRPAEQALSLVETVIGADHPEVAASVGTVASLYGDLAQYLTIAQPFCLRAETIAEKTLGAEHPYLALTLDRLANLYREQNQYAMARKAADKALEIARGAYGDKHPLVARILNTLGRLEIEQGRFRQARPHLKEALKIRQKMPVKECLDVAIILGNLAALDNGPINYSKGVRQYRKAIEMAQRVLGESNRDHPVVAGLMVDLAALLANRGKYADAEPYLGQALEIQEKTLVPYHPELADTLDAYAAVLRKIAAPDVARAKKMETRARDIRAQHEERDRPAS